MTNEQSSQPTLADQVTRLYDLIGGYHATNMLEVARQLGLWGVLSGSPGLSSADVAQRLSTDVFYTDVLCRTAFAFGILDREGDGWRMAPHYDQILGNPQSTFFLAGAARAHLQVGEDYRDYVQHFRGGTRKAFQDHDAALMEEVAASLMTLPRIFLDLVLPQLPALKARFEAGARVLDVGCGAGWAIVQFAERFPRARCVGIDVEPYSLDMARRLIAEHGLGERCEVRSIGIEALDEPGAFDVATSFLVVHELDPALKAAAFASIARVLAPGGSFLIFDEVYPETDAELRSMPKRFGALAQWFEVTWGNVVNTRTELLQLIEDAGLQLSEETGFSRFHIMVATKPE